MLRDLVLLPWPVGYVAALHGEDALLRAPLGFFLPAALLGRLAGFGAAQLALWAWTGMGLGLVLDLLRVWGTASVGQPDAGKTGRDRDKLTEAITRE